MQVVAKRPNRRPIATPYTFLVLLTRTTMNLRFTAGKRQNGDELCTFTLQHHAQFHCVLHLWKESNLRREWNLYFVAVQCFCNALNAIVVREEVCTVLSLSGNSLQLSLNKEQYLRTAQIQVDRIATFCEVDGCLL